MSEAKFDDTYFQTTDGDIAVINLESARRRPGSGSTKIPCGTA